MQQLTAAMGRAAQGDPILYVQLISKFLLITLSEVPHYYNHVILNTDPIAWVVLWISLNSLRDSV